MILIFIFLNSIIHTYGVKLKGLQRTTHEKKMKKTHPSSPLSPGQPVPLPYVSYIFLQDIL